MSITFVSRQKHRATTQCPHLGHLILKQVAEFQRLACFTPLFLHRNCTDTITIYFSTGSFFQIAPKFKVFNAVAQGFENLRASMALRDLNPSLAANR